MYGKLLVTMAACMMYLMNVGTDALLIGET